MKEPYDFYSFNKHIKEKKCVVPPPSAPLPQTLHNFPLISKRPQSNNPPPPSTVSRPCPGLTTEFDKLVGEQDLFQTKFTDPTEDQKSLVYTARHHDYVWRNDTSPGFHDQQHSAVFFLPSLEHNESFKNAIHKEAPDPANLKYVPLVNQNTHAGMLYAKFHGLQDLISEDNNWSLEHRFFQHVVSGKFKNDTVFRGIIHAKVLAKDREIKNAGNQNFKYDTDMDTLFGLIHTISPHAYWELTKHLPMRTERSIKHIISTTPRFPVGITDEIFPFAEKYCEDYKYPRGAPLSLSVDDTKLFAALRPLYDGVKQKWFIVGTTEDHVEVPNPQALNATLDTLKATANLVSKLRLWVLQIPLPGVPPHIRLMEGLVTRGFRITSGGGDGASVERDCQRRTASAGKLVEYRIKHPDASYPDIIVTLHDLNGNVWVVIQDAKHGRKTFKNNAFSGARSLTLGNFAVFYGLVHALGMKVNSPLYRQDFIKSDRMDDPGAARFFSADFLAQAAEQPEENLGLVVYLLVFGDFIDAWQSRTLSHYERAKIVIRTHLSLNTWRSFLAKAGYSEARHFISKEAFDFAQILINGLLGLIIIHRGHLNDTQCPLLPWFNASEPNEHCFSVMRDVAGPDMTMQQAILVVPKLRAKLQSAVRKVKTQTDFKKQASGYCHTYHLAGNIDFTG
ncbi:hypothetical protein DFH07DRAFT_959909 [Mycena maculata]|uniref:Uncharacterized protein n=1 Tax=Mycena maculata TaxID=230809 RepID=A0AAD7NBV8_9AGAR|nr:hypothetical protein DFH07DRAFT_959909 [Mycena maculata]